MNRYHVCDTLSKSGIARYSEDFYRLVLKDSGFELVSPAEIDPLSLSSLPKDSVFHLELGANQFQEQRLLLELQARGFKNISVTLHDPPFSTFPFYTFRRPVLNRLSKVMDWYFNSFGAQRRVLSKCTRVYVLTKKGRQILESRQKLSNVHCLPHIVDESKVSKTSQDGSVRDILYFGFIGPKKGLDFALSLHSQILKRCPDVKIHVVGQATSARDQEYLAALTRVYSDNVIFHGFVQESELDTLFSQVAHVFLPFIEYKYVCPSSASILSCLRRGKIVWTNQVNATQEYIEHMKNGVFFDRSISENVDRFKWLTENSRIITEISSTALSMLGVLNSTHVRAQFYTNAHLRRA